MKKINKKYQMGDALRKAVEIESKRLISKMRNKPIGTIEKGKYVLMRKSAENYYEYLNWD